MIISNMTVAREILNPEVYESRSGEPPVAMALASMPRIQEISLVSVDI